MRPLVHRIFVALSAITITACAAHVAPPPVVVIAPPPPPAAAAEPTVAPVPESTPTPESPPPVYRPETVINFDEENDASAAGPQLDIVEAQPAPAKFKPMLDSKYRRKARALPLE
jgi:hypothetical protein